MTSEMNNGKGFLKEKLDGYQVEPPVSVWNSISAQLGNRRRRRMGFIALSAAASLALAVTLGIQFFGPGEIQDPGMAVVPEQQVYDTPEQAREQTPEQSGDQARERTLDQSAEQSRERTLDQSAEQSRQQARQQSGDQVQPDPVISLRKPSLEERVEMALEENAGVIISEEAGDGTGIAELHQPVESGQEELALNQEGQDEARETDIDDMQVLAEEGILDAGEQISSEGEVYPGEMRQKRLRWVIGAALSPLYSFRDAAPEAIAGMPDHESGMVSYAGGVQVGYRTAGRLAIESGIFFNKMGVSIGAPGVQAFNNEFDFGPIGADASRSEIIAVSNSVGNIITKSGEIYVNNYKLNASYDANSIQESVTSVYSDQGIRQHLDYLEVPLNLRYTVVDRSLKIQLVGGMSTNLLVNNYVTMETAEGPTEIGYLSNIRNVNYSGNAGIGFVYHFLDQLSLSLEPRFRYFLNSVNDATLPSTRPYTFGLYTGVNYTF